MEDPLKKWNEENLLNKAALKCRYDLISINNYNEKKGIETGSHWNLYNPYPYLDNDLLEYKSKLEKKSIEEIGNRTQNVINDIIQKDITKKLHKVNHTQELSKAFQLLRGVVKEPKNKKSPISFRRTKKKKNKKIQIRLNSQYPIQAINKPFTFKKNDYEIKKKIIFDVKPFNMICQKRMNILLPEVEKSRTNMSTITSTDFNYLLNTNVTDYSNRNRTHQTMSLIEEQNLKSIEEDNPLSTCFRSTSFNKVKIPKISLMKRQSKYKVGLLFKDIIDTDYKENKKNINDKDMLNKNLFQTILTQKEKKPKENKQHKKKEIIEKEQLQFPKRFHSFNYNYQNNKREIESSSIKIAQLEKRIRQKFDVMINQVQCDFKGNSDTL